MKRFDLPALAVAALSLGMLLLMGAFVFLRVTGPSDGTSATGIREQGVGMAPLVPRAGGVQSGDVVVAMEGESMETWAQRLLRPDAPRPRWYVGQRVTYTVLRDGRPVALHLALERYPLGEVLRQQWGTLVFAGLFELLAAFVCLRRPDDPAARAQLLFASGLLGSMTWSFGAQASDYAQAAMFWLYQFTTQGFYTFAFCAGLHFALVFPRPARVVRSLPLVIPGLYAMPFVATALWTWRVWAAETTTLDRLAASAAPLNFTVLLYIVLLLLTTVLGYRHADAASRKKLRWVVFGTVAAGGAGVFLGILPEMLTGRSLLSWNEIALLGLGVPVSLAIAILRHQLFDIDVIIRRTLVYTALTSVLALVYFGSVTLLQSLLTSIAGQQSPIAIVISTLAIAALFSPLRRRVQNAIDRRFYRKKYDAARVLAEFGATVRDEVELDILAGRLVAVVEEAMQPERVGLWLKHTANLPDSLWTSSGQQAAVASTQRSRS